MGEVYKVSAVIDAGTGWKSGINDMKSDLSGLDSSVLKIGEGLSSSLRSGLGDFKSIGTSLGSDLTAGLGAQFGTIGTLAGGVASALGPIGIAAGVAGAGLVALGASSVGVASSFQSSMSKVNSVLGGSQADFDKLSQAARDAGATTVFSASQAADGLYYLASAGYTSDESITALKATLNVASAGGMDLARASEMLTTDLAVYGLGANDATRVTDLLAAAASASNSDVGQMGDALGLVGGTAKALGISIEDTTTMLALMANGGTKAAEAGHKLNSILGELTQASSPQATKAQATAMAELGITADQINPTLHSQSEIFSLLKERGMTSAQSLALFGKENNSVASYVTENSDKLDGLSEKILVSGKSAEMAEMMNDNLKGAYAELSSAIEEVQISIGNLFLPALTKIVQGGTKVVSAITSISQSFYTIVTGSQAFAAIGEAASSVGSAISTAFSGLAALVTPAWNAIGGGATVFKALQAAFNLVTAPTTVFFTGLSKLADGLSTVGSAMSPVSSALGGAFGDAITTASAYVQAFVEAFSNLGPIQSFLSTIQGAADTAGKVWDGLSTALPNAFSGAFDAVKSLISQFLSWISDKFGGIFDGVGDQIKTSLEDSALGGVTSFISGIQSRANDILNVGKTTGDKVGEGVENSNLADAPGKALQSDKALAGAEDAGGKLAEKTMSAFAKTASNLGLSDEAYLGILNAQDKVNDKTKTQNLLLGDQEYVLQKIISHQGTNFELLDKSGKVLSSTGVVYTSQLNEFSAALWAEAAAAASSSENSVALQAKLDNLDAAFQSGKISASEYESALSNIAGSMKKIELNSSLWDTANTQKNWSKWISQNKVMADAAGDELSLALYNAMNDLSDESSDAIQSWADSMGISFEAAQATLKEDLQLVMSELANPGSIDSTRLNAAIADLIDSNYISSVWGGKISSAATTAMESFEVPIANAGAWVKSQLSTMAEEASNAWKDGLTQTEADTITAFGPQLEYIKQTYPDLYEQYGGDAMLRLIKAIEDNGGDVEKAMADIGKESGEAFSTSLLDGANFDITLSQLASEPETYAKYITNPLVYAWNSGLEQAQSLVASAKTALTEGGIGSDVLAESIINDFGKVSAYLPTWVNDLVTQLDNGSISLAGFIKTFDAYSEQIDKATEANKKNSDSINTLGSTADANTAKLQNMLLAINPLNEISGKGITVTFTPAEVVATAASNALASGASIASGYLTNGGSAVRIGITAAGQEIAVIGSTAQTQFEAAGGTWVTKTETAADYHYTQVTTATDLLSTALDDGATTIKSALSSYGISTTTGSALSSSLNSAYSSSGSVNLNGADVNGDFEDLTCTGQTVKVNALKYTDASGNTTYYNPLTYLDTVDWEEAQVTAAGTTTTAASTAATTTTEAATYSGLAFLTSATDAATATTQASTTSAAQSIAASQYGYAVSIQSGVAVIGASTTAATTTTSAAATSAATSLTAANTVSTIGINSANQIASTSLSASGYFNSTVTAASEGLHSTLSTGSTEFSNAGTSVSTSLTGNATELNSAASAISSATSALSTAAAALASMSASYSSGGGYSSSSYGGSSSSSIYSSYVSSLPGSSLSGLSVGAGSGYTISYSGYGFAKGAYVTEPTLALFGESGEEMVLPSDITIGLKEMIANGGAGSQSITIEPTVVTIELDGKKLGEAALKFGMKSAQTKGLSIR